MLQKRSLRQIIREEALPAQRGVRLERAGDERVGDLDAGDGRAAEEPADHRAVAGGRHGGYQRQRG